MNKVLRGKVNDREEDKESGVAVHISPPLGMSKVDLLFLVNSYCD